MKVISIVGHKKSGKTRLIEALIPVLAARRHRVGTVKHAPHLLIQEDTDADSARHLIAGAEKTLLIGEDGTALFSDPEEKIERTIDRAFPGFDIVLVEGYKNGPFPKIEIYRQTDANTPPLAATRTVDCLITDDPNPPMTGIPILTPDDIEGIARFIERL